MAETAVEYVVPTAEGGWRISGSRVSLDSLVFAYREGATPEAIAADFPSLSLEQIHGALAFYLRHRQAIDRYLATQERRWEQLRQESEAANADLVARLRAQRSPSSDAEGPR
jgi:uncharacterized protein (DUF433 family)